MATTIQGSTMSKSATMNLNIRVCGAETLVLSGAATRIFIDAINEGDPNTLSDA